MTTVTNKILVISGFTLCIWSGLKHLPSPEVLRVLTPDNVYGILLSFLGDFIKTPQAWAGIFLVILGLREPKITPIKVPRQPGTEYQEQPEIFKKD